jgi:hypothetical protein
LPIPLPRPVISKMSCAISLRWFGRKDTNCTNCYKFNKGIDTNYTNYHEGLRQRVQPIGADS